VRNQHRVGNLIHNDLLQAFAKELFHG